MRHEHQSILANPPRQYRMFGTVIQSDFILYDFQTTTDEQEVSILKRSLPFQMPGMVRQQANYQTNLNDEIQYNIPRLGKFLISKGNRVFVDPHPRADHEVLLKFLLGTVLGTLLHQRGLVPLHGSAIDFNGHGIVFIGNSGAGKSTTSAAMQQRGFPLLTDDICPIKVNSSFDPLILPGLAQIRLKPDSFAKLGLDPHANTDFSLFKAQDKFYSIKDQAPNLKVPLKMIYVLNPCIVSAVQFVELEGGKKITTLIEHTFRNFVVKLLGKSQSHLDQSQKIAERVPITQINRPIQGLQLETFIEKLLNHASTNAH